MYEASYSWFFKIKDIFKESKIILFAKYPHHIEGKKHDKMIIFITQVWNSFILILKMMVVLRLNVIFRNFKMWWNALKMKIIWIWISW